MNLSAYSPYSIAVSDPEHPIDSRPQESYAMRWSHVRGLGSGLIDQSQKITVAAMAMAEKKVWAQRS
jgi:hypothetical protein